jgi:hypothetical protein
MKGQRFAPMDPILISITPTKKGRKEVRAVDSDSYDPRSIYLITGDALPHSLRGELAEMHIEVIDLGDPLLDVSDSSEIWTLRCSIGLRTWGLEAKDQLPVGRIRELLARISAPP